MRDKSLAFRINNIVTDFFTKGHPRTIKAKKNIAFSFVLKTINIATGLLLVPLVLNYLGQTRYGIWLTLASIVTWFNFFDVGLGNGLRNKLSESLARGKNELSRKYVSTTYAVITIISVIFLSVVLILNAFLDWSVLLNTTNVPEDKLNILAFVVFGFFAFRFISKLIGSVLLAYQKPAMNDLINTTGKVLILIIIYVLSNRTKSSLLYVGITYSATPVFAFILFSIILFSKSFKQIAPSVKYVDFSLFKDLFNLGGKFFIIQIAAVILYSSDNFIITQLFSPAEVAPYQIANRYFGIILMGFGILVAPFWSAITEAYTKGEMTWIKNSVKKLVQLWGLAFLALIIMLVLSDEVYHLWIGDKVLIPFELSAAWAFFVGIQTLNTIFVQVINGTGKVKLQMIIGIGGAIINIPLSILLAKYFNMGPTGVIGATIIGQIIALFFIIIQYKKIINEQAYGIWAK